jgi:hypothetical protein
MQRALTDSNLRVHQLQLQVTEQQQPSGRTKDQELQLTMSHLREQNRTLVTEVGELSLLLARGLNEAAFRIAGVQSVQQQQQEQTLSQAAIIARFLESSGRQVLCTSCMASVSKARDALLHPAESLVGSPPPAVGDKSHMAQFTSVADSHPGAALHAGSGMYGGSSARAPLQQQSTPSTFAAQQQHQQLFQQQQQQPQQQQQVVPSPSQPSAAVYGGMQRNEQAYQLSPQQQFATPQQSGGGGAYQAQQQQQQQPFYGGQSVPQGASRPNGQIGAAPVMYGGFVVRNNRGPA